MFNMEVVRSGVTPLVGARPRPHQGGSPRRQCFAIKDLAQVLRPMVEEFTLQFLCPLGIEKVDAGSKRFDCIRGKTSLTYAAAWIILQSSAQGRRRRASGST